MITCVLRSEAKPIHVQALATQPSIKRLTEGMFHGFSRSNEVEVRPSSRGPLFQRARVEFCPVIHRNRARLSQRSLKALTQPIQQRIVKRLRALTAHPRPQDIKKLAGEVDLYRIRDGDDRNIDTTRAKELIVLIAKIGDRNEIDQYPAHSWSDPISHA